MKGLFSILLVIQRLTQNYFSTFFFFNHAARTGLVIVISHRLIYQLKYPSKPIHIYTVQLNLIYKILNNHTNVCCLDVWQFVCISEQLRFISILIHGSLSPFCPVWILVHWRAAQSHWTCSSSSAHPRRIFLEYFSGLNIVGNTL